MHTFILFGGIMRIVEKIYFLSTEIANYAELTCKLLPQIRGIILMFSWNLLYIIWVIFSKVIAFILRKISKWL